MKVPVLETERLRLRQLRLSDADAIQRQFARWSIIQHLAAQVPWPYPDDGARQFLQEVALPAIESGKSLTWAITLADHDGLVGVIDFTFEESELGNRGFWLAEHLWGRGLMTEAVTAMQDYVLLELKVDKIVALNSVANPGSRRIKEKTGARFIGQVEVAHNSGEPMSDKWEITRAAWAAHRGRT